MKPATAMITQPRSNIHVSHRYNAPSECVFDAWLTPETAGLWLFATALRPIAHINIDPRVGGAYSFVERQGRHLTEHTGIYLEIVRPQRLAFTLQSKVYAPEVTHVTIEIVALPAGCELILTHDKLPADRVDGMAARWTGILYGLGEVLAINVTEEPL